MASLSKVVPSGSTDGSPVKIAATATAGTTFHTAGSGTTFIDEVTMYLTNTDSAERTVTIEWTAATAPDFNLKFKVPAGETILAIAGLLVTNSKTVKAFCDAANVVNMVGYINRLSN